MISDVVLLGALQFSALSPLRVATRRLCELQHREVESAEKRKQAQRKHGTRRDEQTSRGTKTDQAASTVNPESLTAQRKLSGQSAFFHAKPGGFRRSAKSIRFLQQSAIGFPQLVQSSPKKGLYEQAFQGTLTAAVIGTISTSRFCGVMFLLFQL
ncbi:MAG: hypothetical protein O2820_18070 [Planctomycetota bacterium]|nr:hypothetical protein [Planctomycetota bacterium]MDA1251127.1 hypothetical protein [Planctomycetota bacterium]